MHISDVLRRKGSAVATVRAGETVRELVARLAEHGVGALVVSEDGRTIDGIVSERDVLRGLHSHGPGLLDHAVSTIMTTGVRTCEPQATVDDLMRLMTDGRFRHVPVVQDGALAGIVSIGDVVKHRIDELQSERDHLVGYITG